MSMVCASEKILQLDLSLFEYLKSQTNPDERRSLLAVHRATAMKMVNFAYLEIGSYLGGTIQPYLLDPRCIKIYSIDPRPPQQPDDRIPGTNIVYEDNSTQHMLTLLSSIDSEAVTKIRCFDMDAAEINNEEIDIQPDIAFIDGEHTRRAVLSDFGFCEQVVSPGGTILFHDFWVIFPAVFEICTMLKKSNRTFIPLKLDGGVFGIFFNPDLLRQDVYLRTLYERNKRFLFWFKLRQQMKGVIPPSMWRLLQNAGRFLKV